MSRLRPSCALVAALALVAAACAHEKASIRFHPDAGDVLRYEVRVHSITDTALEGQPPAHTDEHVLLHAEQTVVDVSDNGAVVRVTVGETGAPPSSFRVRFGADGRVDEVTPEGGSGAASLGIAEVFPAAAGAPPSRPLGKGDRWTIDKTVSVPGSPHARLRGTGRLDGFAVEHGRKLARVSTSSVLPLHTSTRAPRGEVRLSGRQRVEQHAVYDLGDCTVRRAESVSVGRFDVRLLPPSGDETLAVTGTSRVRVVSTTERV